jgi:hypothetical protein
MDSDRNPLRREDFRSDKTGGAGADDGGFAFQFAIRCAMKLLSSSSILARLTGLTR